MEAVIAGGFERSGHDAMAEALEAEGTRRGHVVRRWSWRDEWPSVDEHPVFHVHRGAGRAGFAAFAEVTSDQRLVDALMSDLARLLEGSSLDKADAIVSVHPWGTLALATWLDATASPLLIDCHSEFTPFPVFPHQRVNAYVGGGRARVISREVSRRQWNLGLPVRSSFADPARERSRTRSLVVNAGSDAWAVSRVAPVVRPVTSVLNPESVVFLAPSDAAAIAWQALGDVAPDVRVLTDVTDAGSLLSEATWLLTKSGGTPIAEGLVAGCTVLVALTGVPWEDDGASWLAMQGAVIPVGGSFPLSWSQRLLRCADGSGSSVRALLAGSATAIWRHVESGSPDRPATELEAVAEKTLAAPSEGSAFLLPRTSEELRRMLAGWSGDGDSALDL